MGKKGVRFLSNDFTLEWTQRTVHVWKIIQGWGRRDGTSTATNNTHIWCSRLQQGMCVIIHITSSVEKSSPRLINTDHSPPTIRETISRVSCKMFMCMPCRGIFFCCGMESVRGNKQTQFSSWLNGAGGGNNRQLGSACRGINMIVY
jgi:hypothetical protein